MKIIKRNNDKVEFNAVKIEEAVLKAFNKVYGKEIPLEATELSTRISASIAEYATETSCLITVEEIQDLVENLLMESGYNDVAREYITYRYKRCTERDTYNSLDREIEAVKNGSSESTRDNANKDGKKIQTLKPMLSDLTVINF